MGELALNGLGEGLHELVRDAVEQFGMTQSAGDGVGDDLAQLVRESNAEIARKHLRKCLVNRIRGNVGNGRNNLRLDVVNHNPSYDLFNVLGERRREQSEDSVLLCVASRLLHPTVVIKFTIWSY